MPCLYPACILSSSKTSRLFISRNAFWLISWPNCSMDSVWNIQCFAAQIERRAAAQLQMQFRDTLSNLGLVEVGNATNSTSLRCEATRLSMAFLIAPPIPTRFQLMNLLSVDHCNLIAAIALARPWFKDKHCAARFPAKHGH
jgi:hypothetical protein